MSDGPGSVLVPAKLAASLRVKAGPAGEAWLRSLPRVVARLCRAWGLELVGPYESAHISYVAAVRHRDGTPAVLKVPLTGVELSHVPARARSGEAAALEARGGRGAVRLLDYDDGSGAMLLEQAHPGIGLADRVGLDAADSVLVELLPRLWITPPTGAAIHRLVDLGAAMAQFSRVRYQALRGPFEPDLLNVALAAWEFLSAGSGEEVLLHGDPHHANIVSLARGWVAIDPLPMIGERAYDVVQFLLFRKGDMDDPQASWNEAIANLSGRIGVDPVRVRAWLLLRLVSDALASLTDRSTTIEQLEAFQDDLWSARLVRQFA